MHVCNLFISPGHNFYGHHGQPAGKHPIMAVTQIECVAGRGFRSDRFFDYKPDYKGQITFFAGVEFEIQGMRFAGTEECSPCYWMNNIFRDERIETWLQGRGGLRARILTDGVLECER